MTTVDIPCCEVLGVYESQVLFAACEESRLQDLNGDGDFNDWMLHVYDHDTGRVTNLGVDSARLDFITGPFVILPVSEVPHVLDLTTKSLRSLPAVPGLLAVNSAYAGLPSPAPWVAYGVLESRLGQDLNGDGDTDDTVVQALNLASDETVSTGRELTDWGPWGIRLSYPWVAFCGPGHSGRDEPVLQLHNLETGTTNEDLAGSVAGFFFTYCDADRLVWIDRQGGGFAFDFQTRQTELFLGGPAPPGQLSDCGADRSADELGCMRSRCP